jgi:hypothetical protein
MNRRIVRWIGALKDDSMLAMFRNLSKLRTSHASRRSIQQGSLGFAVHCAVQRCLVDRNQLEMLMMPCCKATVAASVLSPASSLALM